MSDDYQWYGQNSIPRRGRYDPPQDDGFLRPNRKYGSQRSSLRDSTYGTEGNNSPPPRSPVSFDEDYDRRHASDGDVSDYASERYRRGQARQSRGSDYRYSSSQYDHPSHGRSYEDFNAGMGSQHAYHDGVDDIDEIADQNIRIQELTAAKDKAEHDYQQLQSRMNATIQDLRCTLYETLVGCRDQETQMIILLDIIHDKRERYYLVKDDDDAIVLAAIRRTLAEKLSSLLQSYYFRGEHVIAQPCIQDYVPEEMRDCPEMREAHFWHHMNCSKQGGAQQIQDATIFHDNARSLLYETPDTNNDAEWALRNSKAYFDLVLGNNSPSILATEAISMWNRCAHLRQDYTTELAKQLQAVAATMARNRSDEGVRHARTILKRVCHSDHFDKIEDNVQHQIRFDLMVAYCNNKKWTEAQSILKSLQQPSSSTSVRYLDQLKPDLDYYKLLIHEKSGATWSVKRQAALDYFKAHGYRNTEHLKYAVSIMVQYCQEYIDKKKPRAEQMRAFETLTSFAKHASYIQHCALCTDATTRPALLKPLYDLAVKLTKRASGMEAVIKPLKYVVDAAPTTAAMTD
jgi:hypothetical protein